jgi:predicted O-methyltransferase YrrM
VPGGQGVGAAELSRYCDKVITIDLKRGKLERAGETFDRHALWASLGVTNIDLRLIANDKEKAALIAGLEFDFAFIDGAHDRTVANDFALVKKCGAVLFHDYDRRGVKEQDFVFDFVNTLPKDQVTVRDIFAFWRAPRG